MRIATRALALVVATGSIVAGLAAPASATPDPCPGGEPICLYVNGMTIPVGNIITMPATGLAPIIVPGPRVCDTGTGECTDTFIQLPGATVSSTPSTFATVTLPGFGVGIDGLVPTVYVGIPGVELGTIGALGITVKVYVPLLLLRPDDLHCAGYEPPIGPVSFDYTSDCYFVVTVAV